MNENHQVTPNQVIEVLKTIIDPEIPINIWDLGLIYAINILPENQVEIVMTLTSKNCPAIDFLPMQIEDEVCKTLGLNNCYVVLTFDPPWSLDILSEETKIELGLI